MPWTAAPAAAPAIAVEADEVGGTVVYASWNGATEVAYWKVLGGMSAASLAALVTVPRDGFETAITIHSSNKYFAVEALNSKGQRLSVSKTVAG